VPIKTKLSTIDPQTGQVLEVFHAFVKDIVRDKQLRPTLYLLAYIMSEKLERDSLKFYMTAEEVVKNLGISRRTFYKWLKILTERGYIIRIATNYYALNL